MAILNERFSPAQHTPLDSYEPVPEGHYTVRIVDSELKANNNNNGEHLMFTLEIVDGAHSGRKIFERINWRNANPLAEDYGRRTLTTYCAAVGFSGEELTDTQQLHGTPFKVRIVIRTDKTGTYAPSNEVKEIKKLDTPQQIPAAPQHAPAEPPAMQPPVPPPIQAPAAAAPPMHAPAEPAAPLPPTEPNGLGEAAPATPPAWAQP